MLVDIGLLVLRIVVGLLLMGHGAQKLFGWFGGPGLKGVMGWFSSMGVKPASFWAFMAGLAEFGGGLLFALGLFDPIGSFGIIAAMVTAIVLVHWGKGMWAGKGGSELPLTNLVAALAVAFSGPGTYSLDRVFGIVLPEPISLRAGGLVVVVIGVAAVLLSKRVHPVTSNQPKAA